MLKTLRRSSALTLFLLLSACSSDSGTSNSSAVSNGLSASYPSDLAITSPFATGNAVEGLVKRNPRALDENAPLEPPTFDQRKQDILDRLEATDAGKCAFAIKLFRPVRNVNCYGPQVNYTGHPDGAPTAGNLPPGDAGIWNEAETNGEACVAAKMNSLISEVQAQVDVAVNLVTAMLCIAKVKGDDVLPGAGETKDFKTALADAGTPFTFETAGIARETDTSDGHSVYLSSIKASATPDGRAITTDLHLRHIPTSSDNSAYRGRLWYTISGDVGNGGNCGAGGPKLFGVSVLYEKNAAGKLNYRMQRAAYCDAAADPFDAKKNIDGSNRYNANNPAENPLGWADNYNDATFNLNSSDGTGVVSYAWQAGSRDSHTRVLLAELNAGSPTSGCGYFGFGPNSTSTDIGKIDGMICNWAGPMNQHNPNGKVQRQCMAYDTTDKIFKSDSAQLAISYAPRNSCDSTGLPSFIFDGRSNVTSNLVDVSVMEADISLPDKPADL